MEVDELDAFNRGPPLLAVGYRDPVAARFVGGDGDFVAAEGEARGLDAFAEVCARHFMDARAERDEDVVWRRHAVEGFDEDALVGRCRVAFRAEGEP